MPLFRRFAVFALAVSLLAGASTSATAQTVEPPVPDALAPWVDWVMYDQPELDCPQIDGTGGGRLCVWPGTLSMEVGPDGARFSMNVWLATRGDVRLPGDNKHWPQEVTADANQVIVKDDAGYPTVALGPGSHRLSGEFRWSSAPEVLAAPAEVGRVSLRITGDEVERPQLDAQSAEHGRLWLHSAGADTQKDETDSIRTSIYRRIEDDSPLRVITQLELNVSGKAREIDMGEVLVANSRPTSVDSQLPVKVDRDGRVAIYARPGTHKVTIESVLNEKSDKLAVPQPGPDFYDPQEVWTWIPDELIRSVEVSGLQTVDPSRTSLPGAWRGHTTFLAEPGQALELEVTRRGVTASPNTVELDRQLWLDVDGDGFTIRDRLTGGLHKDWRLDYVGKATLGHATNGGDDVLITKNPDTGESGVELRKSALNLSADLRLESSKDALPAVGWDHDVQRLSATLMLPPGWTLFAAGGADEVDGTWLDSWTLWDFFFVLMVALSIGKLLGWRWTPLAIVALVASHGHSGAPMWVWIHLVAALALLRVLPEGWWRRGVHVYRVIVLLVLFGVLANFAHDQIRAGLHPQVDSRAFRTGGGDDFSLGMAEKQMAPTAPMQMADEQMAEEAAEPMPPAEMGAAERNTAGPELDLKAPAQKNYRQKRLSSWIGSGSGKKLDLQQVDPKAVVQTGPGLPNWSWNRWRLEWNGPVSKDHELDLWLVSPTINRMLAFLRVALLIVLALLMVLSPGAPKERDDDDESDEVHWGGLWKKLTHAGAVLLASGLVLGASPGASAQPAATPPTVATADHLDTLRKRLIEARQCDGVCVLVSHTDIRVDGLDVTIRAEVHAQSDSGWHLPGPADAVHIDSVEIDGTPSTQLRREPGGLTAVRVPAGRHTIEVAGRLPNRNVVTVQFNAATRPKQLSFASAEWTADGISPQGVPDNSIQLTRKKSAGSGEAAGVQQAPELPPWYQVHRLVGLGLPWKVRTTVTRQNTTRPQLVKIPLVDGEKVITDGLRVEDGRVLVDFPRGESVVEYVSELPIREKVELVAPTDKPWSETWTVECSRIWRCGFSELPPVELVGDDDVFRPTWKPWPGESLAIDIERPEGAEGQSSTVDSVDYRVTPGKRLLQATLQLTIRSSQGGWQTITLPEGAELQSTTIDEEERSLRLEDRKLALPIRPGQHHYRIEWQQPWERSFIERMPQVDIGTEAANVELHIERGQDRWLLRTMGPQWGPAVLFWSHLVILLVIAVLLSRLRGLPLKTHEWMLLVVGMSQLPYLALIPVVGWFAALKLRQARPAQEWWKFDFVQLVLVGLTIAAGVTLYAAVHSNLLFQIDMQVEGAKSADHLLRWYVDRSGAELPTPAVASLPLLVWRVLMLLWAFWLVSRLLAWVPWGWQAFSEGALWRGRTDTAGAEDAEGAEAPQQPDTPQSNDP